MSLGNVILAIVKQQLRLEDRLMTALDNELAKFQGTCPPKDSLLQIIQIKNINTGIQNIQSAISSTQSIESTTTKVLTGSEILINIALLLPLPNQLTTVGITNTFTTKLIALKDAIRTGKALASSITIVVDTLQGIVFNIQAKLNQLDQAIQRCAQLQGVEFEVTNDFINNSTEASTEAVYNSTATYKGFLLEVKLTQEPYGSLRKRYGQATDNRGVVAFKTQETFATDTTIILEELKFLIDNR